MDFINEGDMNDIWLELESVIYIIPDISLFLG